MKILIFSIVFASGLLMGAGQSLSSGEDEIIEYVAHAYNVTNNDVTLQSPNSVLVNLGLGTSSQGAASFTSCGTDCTEVTIVFPDRTLNFIVEDQIQGL